MGRDISAVPASGARRTDAVFRDPAGGGGLFLPFRAGGDRRRLRQPALRRRQRACRALRDARPRLDRGIRLLGRRRGGQLLRQRDPHGAQGAPFRDPQRQRHGQLYGLGLPHGLPVSVSADGGLHHPRGRAAREKTPLLFIPCHGRTRPCDLSDAQRHLPPRHGAALPARRERGNSLVAARRRHRFGADLHALDGGGARSSPSATWC